MKLHKLLPASLGVLVLFSAIPAAFAGSAGVTNSWSTRDIKNGKSTLNVDVYDKYDYHRDAQANAWKKEFGYTTITDNASSSGGGEKICKDKCNPPSSNGGDDSTQFAEVDVFWAGSDSYAKEWGNGYTTTAVKMTETYDFSGFDKTHSVSSDFSY